MAVLRPRTRVVFFRVSQDEFQQFMQACESSGARSASDFARMAVQRMIAAHDPPEPLSRPALEPDNVDAALKHLAARLDQLSELIRERIGKPENPRKPEAGRRVYAITGNGEQNPHPAPSLFSSGSPRAASTDAASSAGDGNVVAPRLALGIGS